MSQDLIQGNLAKGDGQGYRFHESTLKFAIYYSGVAGTAAYNALRQVLALPSPSHIKRLRARAVPPESGVLVGNIQVTASVHLEVHELPRISLSTSCSPVVTVEIRGRTCCSIVFFLGVSTRVASRRKLAVSEHRNRTLTAWDIFGISCLRIYKSIMRAGQALPNF